MTRPAPVLTLQYSAKAPDPGRQLLRWVSGLLPTIILFLAFMDNAATGDPVDSVGRFTAYHYVSVLVALLPLIWLLVMFRTARNRSRYIIFIIACVWASVNLYWTYLFIHDVRTDPASAYYFSIWKPIPFLR